jgi:NDP-sugar pyrophosphorylase family protein
MLGSPGNKSYVRSFIDGIENGDVVVRQGEEYLDGETGELLEFESVYVAEAAVILKGDPATVMLSKSTREVRKGDRLLSVLEDPVVQNYFPHVLETDIKGRG